MNKLTKFKKFCKEFKKISKKTTLYIKKNYSDVLITICLASIMGAITYFLTVLTYLPFFCLYLAILFFIWSCLLTIYIFNKIIKFINANY